MLTRIRIISGKILRIIGERLISLSQNMLYKKSKLIKKGEDRNLYLTSSKELFWLNQKGYIDQHLIEFGEFEKQSTSVVKKLVKRGNTVLDIGANIGYYSILMSKLVGNSGRIIAFEPTEHFAKVLKMNLVANSVTNVDIVKMGLSDRNQTLEIDIGPSSATLHSPLGFDIVESKEKINLTTLDDYVQGNDMDKIDFIKIDIDGHEPLFFKGAWETIYKYDPVILLEISHLHYLEAGFTAWEFYDVLKGKNFKIYHEDQLQEIDSKEVFLRRCANFSYSTNIVISRKPLNIRQEKHEE